MKFPDQTGPGVYKILNSLNGKVYVGSTKNLRRRAKAHFDMLQSGRHCNPHLQASWKKYGRKYFRFEVLEECESDVLDVREQYWLDELEAYKKGYNRCPLAYRPAMSQTSIAKMAKTKTGKKLKPETRAKMSAVRKGKKQSESHRESTKRCHWSKGPRAAEIGARISATRLARGIGCTPEAAAKISETKLRQAAEKRAAALAPTNDALEP